MQQGDGDGVRTLWLLGNDCRDWLASAVIDQHLLVRWAPSTDHVPSDPVRALAGILVLSRSDTIPADLLAQLAPAWTILQVGPGWGGRRVERQAAAALSVIPNCRFVPLPDQSWTRRARAAGIQTRESLAEILASLGLPGIVLADQLPGRARARTRRGA